MRSLACPRQCPHAGCLQPLTPRCRCPSQSWARQGQVLSCDIKFYIATCERSISSKNAIAGDGRPGDTNTFHLRSPTSFVDRTRSEGAGPHALLRDQWCHQGTLRSAPGTTRRTWVWLGDKRRRTGDSSSSAFFASDLHLTKVALTWELSRLASGVK